MTEHRAPTPRYLPPSFVMRHIVNPLTAALGGPTLVVRGRRSGRRIRTVVPPFVEGGVRYLVAGGGETQWVRNLRAAGEGELWRGRRHEPFRAVELHGAEQARVVSAYRRRLGRRAGPFFTAMPDPADHPVFRIEP
ncbi:MAG TPA: nitroreductase/quinone reductase family protein [Candidatus Sulfotelmatobacter sp.]|nr:nitroreductase/quinone reductase family protein [Candidatus Sulfotelmatobacter sp.]HXY27344.1 nitroreductase/quinone reductase family protein [Acidimicrobiales bacterium]